MVPKTCSIPECGRSDRMVRGWCNKHYTRWRTHGDPLRNITEEKPKHCTIPGCSKASIGRGYCSMHYQRWERTGDPLAVVKIYGDDDARFWSKVSKTDGCWEWTDYVDPDGYGRFFLSGKSTMPHRVSYEWAVGPIPEGMEIDHKCFKKYCVNPNHLRLATRKQNGENLPGPPRNNRSGFRGVHWNKRSKKWRAQVKHKGKSITVGHFNTAIEADRAATAKRNELFTHNLIDRIAV